MFLFTGSRIVKGEFIEFKKTFPKCEKTKIQRLHINNKSNVSVEGLYDKLLRFHVIANSDTDRDQQIKLKVRDAILLAYHTELLKCETKQECVQFLQHHIQSINELADRILGQNHAAYRSTTLLGDFSFPVKAYGNYILPPGRYHALRVVLGKGMGHNWWCIMFPPLCFVNITTSSVLDKDNQKLLKVLDCGKSQDTKAIHQQNDPLKMSNKTNDKYVFKLKIPEMIGKWFKNK